MIWFSCKKCGKVLGRADGSAGALIFCECGQGLRVPWESTAAAPPVESLPVSPAQALEPIRFEAEEPPSISKTKRRDRRARMAPIDPNTCFNHALADKFGVCADCGLSFCARCLATFQKSSYCSPCKNYRTRLLQRRPDSSKLALLSFLIALAAGPAMFILSPFATSNNARSFMLLALMPPALALAAGIVALRWIRAGENRTGQQLAVSGMSLGTVVGIMTVLLVFFGHKLWA